jgi:PAS domain S-box-containing protein
LLERIATGDALPELLAAVVRFIEEQSPGMIGSIVLVDNGRIRTVVGDNLPAAYRQALVGLPIGPRAGSCGTAAFTGERVIAEDVETSEFWVDYRHLVRPHGLRACWSSPVRLPEKGVVGTFAMYYCDVRSPTPAEIRWIDEATCLAVVAIRRDLAQRALRASEARLQAVIEHTPNVAIQLFDKDARVQFANSASRRLFAWKAGSEIGKSLDQLNFPIDEARRFAAAVDHVRVTGEAVGPIEFRFDHPSGGEGVLLSTVFEVPQADEPFCCACMDVDLTDYRRLEEAKRVEDARQALVYRMVTDVIFYLGIEDGPRYRFLSVNDAFLRATGLQEGEVVGHLVEDVIPPPSLPLVLERYREAALTGVPVTWDEESRYPSGVKRGEVTLAPVLDAQGRCTHLIGTVHDVTERVAADSERRRLELQLHHAQRLQSLGTLASGIAHDFNNIVTAISGHAELALNDVSDRGAVSAGLEEICRSADRAADLVRRILLFSRGDEPKLQTMDAPALIDEVVTLLRATLPASIDVRTNIAAETWRLVGDSTQVHQVMVNLITNAAQAIGANRGTIDVSSANVFVSAGGTIDPALPPGRYVRVSVGDNGCGMDEMTLARAFEPFFTTKGRRQGTGLGLSVVHGIMKNHSGAVTVNSTPGQGTVFHLFFPAAEVDASLQQDSHADGARVLFVDGDGALAHVTIGALKRLGHRVTNAAAPEEALSRFRREPRDFDVVVADTAMPGISGVAFLAAVRAIRANMPAVLLSDYISDADAEAAHRLGVDVLLKPRSPQALTESLHRHIGGAFANPEN